MMVKLTVAIIIFIVVAIAWIRAKWGRSKNKNASKQIVEDLRSRKHDIESYAESFDIMICSKPLTKDLDTRAIQQYLQSLNGKKLGSKFTIEYGDMNEKIKGLVIGEGLVRDQVYDRQIDIHYPCWLYIEKNEERNEIAFRSTFPENKDHHYLLEDLSGMIYDNCMKN